MTEDEFVEVVTEGQPAAPALLRLRRRREPQRPRAARRARRRRRSPIDDVLAAAGAAPSCSTPASRPSSPRATSAGSINVGPRGPLRRVRGDVCAPSDRHRARRRPGAGARGQGPPRPASASTGSVGAARRPEPLSTARPDQVAAQLAAHRDASSPSRALDPDGCKSSTSATPPSSRRVPSRRRATIPLPAGSIQLEQLDPKRPTVVYCAGGYRSVDRRQRACRAAGFADVSDLLGGWLRGRGRCGREKHDGRERGA